MQRDVQGATLSALLAILRPADRVLVLRRMGPHECKLAAAGAAEELRTGPCAEVLGGWIVESASVDGEAWTGEIAPVLFVTVEAEKPGQKAPTGAEGSAGAEGSFLCGIT